MSAITTGKAIKKMSAIMEVMNRFKGLDVVNRATVDGGP